MTETRNTPGAPLLPAAATTALWVAYVVVAAMVGLTLLEQWQPLIALSAISLAAAAALLIAARRMDRQESQPVIRRPAGSALGHARQTRVA